MRSPTARAFPARGYCGCRPGLGRLGALGALRPGQTSPRRHDLDRRGPPVCSGRAIGLRSPGQPRSRRFPRLRRRGAGRTASEQMRADEVGPRWCRRFLCQRRGGIRTLVGGVIPRNGFRDEAQLATKGPAFQGADTPPPEDTMPASALSQVIQGQIFRRDRFCCRYWGAGLIPTPIRCTSPAISRALTKLRAASSRAGCSRTMRRLPRPAGGVGASWRRAPHCPASSAPRLAPAAELCAPLAALTSPALRTDRRR